MVRTAAAILADIRANGDELAPDVAPADPDPAEQRNGGRRLRGVVDIDMGAGRLTCGWADIHRYATVWYDDTPPAPQRERQGCPSEGAYRRHLRDGEKCRPCRQHVNRLEQDRRRKRGGR